MPHRLPEPASGDPLLLVRELREKVQEMEEERGRQQRQSRRQLVLLGLALSLAAHLGLMAILAAIHRAGHGGGPAPQPVSYEFAIIQEEQLTEMQSREFDELVPETLEFQDLVPTEAAAEFAVDASAPELELSGGSAVPSLGGAGGGSGGTPGLGGGGAGTSFFGITSEGTRFAFIVDISGSMGQGSKLATAMEELANSIQALPDFAHFYIVLFSSGHVVPPMQRGWTRARPSTVRTYVRWLREVSPGGGTEPRSAFDVVFALDVRPDVVYFLTDGQITGMSAEDVAAMNRRGKGVIINTVAFGDLGRQELLRRIARESDGTHKDVPSF